MQCLGVGDALDMEDSINQVAFWWRISERIQSYI